MGQENFNRWRLLSQFSVNVLVLTTYRTESTYLVNGRGGRHNGAF